MSIDNNLFTDLDFSNTGRVEYIISRGNPLQTVNLKNGYSSDTPIQIILANAGDTLLRFLCVDDSEIASWANSGFPNLVVNSYCSYTPGGSYNTITGRVTYDADNNGCDASDIARPNLRVNINDGTNTGASFTDGNGDYTYYTHTGNFTVTPNIQNSPWFTFSPASTAVPFADSNNNTVTQNFCLTANGSHPDLEVVIYPFGSARPGFDAEYMVNYVNKGNLTLSGNVTFSFDDAVSDFVSSNIAPDAQATGSLTYNYTNLMPFESRRFFVTLNTNSPTETPAVNNGDVLSFTAAITPNANDETPSDNTFQLHQTVTNSLDPNEIVCSEGNIVSPTKIGDYLHYVVNFENTGTAAAQNIVVKDIIDTTKFDVNSLQVLNSSATAATRLTGNVAEFILQNINLQPQAHGNVSFKIKTKNTLVAGNTVTQSAGIYFDYNFPVATAPENTIFQALSNPDFNVDAGISLYLNPSKGNVNINCTSNIKTVELYDVQGRLLQTSLVNENQVALDISNQSGGIYFIKVISDNGMKVQRIVKE